MGTNEHFWAFVGAIASLGATIAAVIALRQTAENQAEERESKRPYCVFEDVTLKGILGPGGPQITLRALLKNVGSRPASNVQASWAVLAKHIEDPRQFFFLKGHWDNANDLNASGTTPFEAYIQFTPLPNGLYLRGMEINVTLQFLDSVMNKVYTQVYYFKTVDYSYGAEVNPYVKELELRVSPATMQDAKTFDDRLSRVIKSQSPP